MYKVNQITGKPLYFLMLKMTSWCML